MQVIPPGANFNFLMGPFLKVFGLAILLAVLFRLVFRTLFGRLPRKQYNEGLGIAIAVGFTIGLYLAFNVFHI